MQRVYLVDVNNNEVFSDNNLPGVDGGGGVHDDGRADQHQRASGQVRFWRHSWPLSMRRAAVLSQILSVNTSVYSSARITHPASHLPLPRFISLEAKLDVMMRLQDQQRVARRASPDGAQVGGGGGGGASNHEIQPRPAAAMPQNSPDHGNNQPPMPAPLPPSPPKRVRGGARTLQDKYPVASSIGCRYVLYLYYDIA